MKKHIETEIIINSSPEILWNKLTNLEYYSTWNPFIIQSFGEIKEGNIIENHMKNGDKIMVFKPLITKVVKHEYFEWLGSLWTKGIFDGRHYFKIEKINEHQVKLIHGEKFSGILSGLILKLIGESTKHNFILMNEALKNKCEE